MIASRRRLFGLLAAPAVVSITGRLSPGLLRPPLLLEAQLGEMSLLDTHWEAQPHQLIVSPENEAAASRILDYHRFREIVEPMLREHFDKVYDVPAIDRAIHASRDATVQITGNRAGIFSDAPEHAHHLGLGQPQSLVDIVEDVASSANRAMARLIEQAHQVTEDARADEQRARRAASAIQRVAQSLERLCYGPGEAADRGDVQPERPCRRA